MVYGFVRQSGGHVHIDSEEGHGTTVVMCFPRAPEKEPVTEGDTSIQSEPRGQGQTIVVVEDDEDVRHYVVMLLVGLGYRTLEAGDGDAALELLADIPSHSLLFTDVVLPGGMNGLELAREARRRQPDLRILFTSGYEMDVMGDGGKPGETFEIIRKPFKKAELAQKLRAVLEV
jgi:CheY-like chemotaxis protein